MSKSVLKVADQRKIIRGLEEQGVSVEPGRMGHYVLKFENGDSITVNLATGDSAGVARSRTIIRRHDLHWPLDPPPHTIKTRAPVDPLLESRDGPDWGEAGYQRADLPHVYRDRGDSRCRSCGKLATDVNHTNVAEAKALGIPFGDPPGGYSIEGDRPARTVTEMRTNMTGGPTDRPLPPEALATPINRKKATVPVKKPKTQSSEVLSEWIDLTPTLAQQLLMHNTDNRPIRKGHVLALARDMAQGRWRVTGDSIKIDTDDKMIDGQHRCYAVIESGVSVRALLVIGLDPEAREVIDTNARRSAADALGFAGLGKSAHTVAAAARIAIGRETGFYTSALDASYPKVTNSEVVAWVEAHPDIHDAVSLGRKTERAIGLSGGPWAYCLWELRRISPDEASEFAFSLAEFRTEGTGDPRAALLTAVQRARAARRALPASEILFIVFRVWNAWRSNAQVKRINPVGNRADMGGGVIPDPQ